MTGNGVSKRFKIRLLCLGAAFSLLAQSYGLADETVATAPSAAPSHDELYAELSAKEAKDGSVLLIDVFLPEKLQKSKVVADFEGVKPVFYPAPKLGAHAYQAVMAVPFNHKPGPVEVSVL